MGAYSKGGFFNEGLKTFFLLVNYLFNATHTYDRAFFNKQANFW